MKHSIILFFTFFVATTSACLGQYTVLHNFNGADGATPNGTLLLSKNLLYGMTRNGGIHGDGTIFSIDTNGNSYRKLHDFDSLNGCHPYGSVVLAGNTIYGMTLYGGKSNRGIIFSMDSSGSSFKVLLNFNDTNGACPWGSLLFLNNKLYGMVERGGTYNGGRLFSIDTNGSGFSDIFDFYIPGALPTGSLIVSGKYFYGMTWGLGIVGNIFSIDTNGNNYKDLHDFQGELYNDGSAPYGDLTLFGKKLFGMTSLGGFANWGTVFSIDTDGSEYKILINNGGHQNGASPYGNLTLMNNRLYGMTYADGIHYGGDIFSIDTNAGEYVDLYEFNSPTGSSPWGNLTSLGNLLYSMTTMGGTYGDGVIFKIDTGANVTGINELTQNSDAVKLFPNPSNGKFTIEVKSEELKTKGKVEVFNMLGQEVYATPINPPIQADFDLNMSSQPSGIYFYRVMTETGSLVGEGKFIIQ